MEFLLMSLTVLVYTMVGGLVYYIVSAIIDEITEWRDYKAGNAILHKKNNEIRSLEQELALWKTACDNLDEEVKVLNEVQKKGTTT